MELIIFRSGKGDCLLLTSTTGRTPKRILIDGGMPKAFKDHVADHLSKVPQIDVAYVSHIDQDHIGGVLAMIDDMYAWRVYDFKRATGEAWKKPSAPRPPVIKEFWHNGFDEQVSERGSGFGGGLENALEIAALLRRLPAMSTTDDGHRQHDPLEATQDLATSIAEAIKLRHRLGEKQLGIPLNKAARGKLIVTNRVKSIDVGPLKFTTLGPSKEFLEELRLQWNDWLRDNRDTVRKMRDKSAGDADRLESSIALARLGDRRRVSVPNIASLMFLVEEGDRSLLLTGDGHWEDILDGLRKVRRFRNGHIHLDVLKGQHHGSEHNWHADFCSQVTADHYVFCGNGEHENPDLEVIELVAQSRLGLGSAALAGPEAPFTLWFSGNSRHDDEKRSASEHMASVESLTKKLQRRSRGRMRIKFMPAKPAATLSLRV